MKIIKIIKFQLRFMKIIEILQLHARIMKIIEILKLHLKSKQKNNENHSISLEHH